MSEFSGINSAMNYAADSLSVHSVKMQVTAHNIANISTANFTPQRATFVDGPAGLGVNLESVRKIESTFTKINESSSAALSSIWGGAQPSGTEIAKEIPHMISTQHAYNANATTVRAVDEMYDSLLSLKV